MKALFAPAVALMNRWKYPQRFLFIGLFVLLVTGVLLGTLVMNIQKTIDLSKNELAALELLRPLTQQVQLIQQHRGLMAGVLGGEARMQAQLTAKETDIEALLLTLEAARKRLQVRLPVNAAEINALQQSWSALQGTPGLKLTAAESFARHTALIKQLREHQVNVADTGMLSGDPDLDTFYLIDSLLHRLPDMLEQLGQLRALGTGLLARAELTDTERTQLEVHLSILQQAQMVLQQNLLKAGQAAPSLKEPLSGFGSAMDQAALGVVNILRNDVLAGQWQTSPEDYFVRASKTIDLGYQQLFETLMPRLEKQIQARIRALDFERNRDVAIALGLILLMGWLAGGVYGSVMAAVLRLQKASQAMAAGDMTQPVRLQSRDELALVATSMDEMRLGLNRLLGQVRQTANEVAQASSTLADTAAQVASKTSEQSGAAISMAAAIEELTSGIENIASHAGMAEQSSTESGEISLESARIVEGTVAEIQNIATTVNQSAGIVEELGQHTGRISAIINGIREIADQTNLLALNAAIEAARAGEQGRGFAVVADEVRKLAERTAQQTQEIVGMIGTIHNGTAEAVNSMKHGVERVAEGVQLSQQAGESIARVREGSNQVVQVVHEINLALKEQSQASNDIARNVESIAQAGELNSTAVASLAMTAEQLKAVAAHLQSGVERFRLA